MLLAAASTGTAGRSALVLIGLTAGTLATLVAAAALVAVAALVPTLAPMTLGARLTGLLGVELVGVAAGMCRPATFAGDFALAFAVHARKATVGLPALLASLSALVVVASHMVLL